LDYTQERKGKDKYKRKKIHKIGLDELEEKIQEYNKVEDRM